MKKLVILISVFSIFFTLLTFLNHELEVLENKLEVIELENRKLEYELNFVKTEWEYVNTPQNIALLTKKYFNHKPAELMNVNDFMIKVLNAKGE